MSGWHSQMRTVDGGPILAFYEKVRVQETAKRAELRGRFGWVLGVSAEDGIVFGYQVHFDDLPTGYGFDPAELEGTGEIAPRERFYAGESIRVRVDEKGRGHLVR